MDYNSPIPSHVIQPKELFPIKNWYKKQLFSYFPIFLLTITVIVLIGLVVVSDISRRETQRANEIFAQYISGVVVRSLNEVEQAYLKEFTLNENLRDFINDSRQENMMLYEVASSLRTLENNYSLIESVYMYRTSDHLVIMSNGKSYLEQFYDRDFLKSVLASGNASEEWTEARNAPGFYDNRTTSVISLVKRLPIPFGTDGYAVINVNVQGFANELRVGTNRNITYMDIVDRHGQVLLSSESARNKDPQLDNINFLAQMPVDKTSWTIRSGTKSGQWFQWFEFISYTWIAAGIGVVVLSVIYVIYISRRNYKPIAMMLNKLEKIRLTSTSTKAEEGDIRFIEHALEELTVQMKQYEEERQDNLLAKRRQLFIDLIEGAPIEFDGFWTEQIPLLHENFHDLPKRFILAEMQLDATHSDNGDQALIRLALQNIVQEFFGGQTPPWSEWIYGNRLGIICTFDNSSEAQEQIRALAKDCRSWVKDHLNVSFIFGVGHSFEDWTELPHSYQTARQALDFQLTRRDEAVIFSDELHGAADQKWMQNWPLLEEIAEGFQMRNERWVRRLDELFRQFRLQRIKDQAIFTMIDTLVKLIQKEVGDGIPVLDVSASLWEGKQPEDAPIKHRELRTFEPLVKEVLSAAYHHYVAIYESGGIPSTILEVKAYIVQHFDHPDLSLKHITDRFQLNGKNVSQLFKDAFGENFGDFVLQLRIDKAKKLLLETDMPQQEIAPLVGYSNSITFGRMFKRVVGMTPGEYRKKNTGS